MREQEIEDNLIEDFLDKHDATGKEARAYAHGAVVDIMSSQLQSGDEDLATLSEFSELFDGIEETLDIRNNVNYNRDK